MDRKIIDIWIESEINGRVRESNIDDNSDVIVTFTDSKRFVATFFTYNNIKTLTEKNKVTGEMLSGTYFCATQMILIDQIDSVTVGKVIDDLIENGDFYKYFSFIE